MTPTQRKAMEQALSTVKILQCDAKYEQDCNVCAIEEALRAALAEPQAEDVAADAYNHACNEMERWQHQRRLAGKEVGTTRSLCDGIAWLYSRIDELERAALAEPQQEPVACIGMIDEAHFANDLYAAGDELRRLYAENEELKARISALSEHESVATVQTINGLTIGYLETKLPVGTKIYTAPQPTIAPEYKRTQAAPNIVTKEYTILGHGGKRTYYKVYLAAGKFTLLLNDPYETSQDRAATFAQEVSKALMTPQPAKQQLENLSDKEIKSLIPPSDSWKYEIGFDEAVDFAHSVIAAYKAKNGIN